MQVLVIIFVKHTNWYVFKFFDFAVAHTDNGKVPNTIRAECLMRYLTPHPSIHLSIHLHYHDKQTAGPLANVEV